MARLGAATLSAFFSYACRGVGKKFVMAVASQGADQGEDLKVT